MNVAVGEMIHQILLGQLLFHQPLPAVSLVEPPDVHLVEWIEEPRSYGILKWDAKCFSQKLLELCTIYGEAMSYNTINLFLNMS